MDADVMRGRILGRLDAYDAEHDTLGCHYGHCIHDALTALRAVLAEVAAWPAGGRSRAGSVERVIAEALGITDGGGSDAG